MKISSLFLSFFICIILTFIGLNIPDPQGGVISNYFIVELASHVIFGIIGLVGFILRISKFIRRSAFYYIFVGISNVWLGSLIYLLYFMSRLNLLAIEMASVNLLIGIVVLVDIGLGRQVKTQ